MKIVSICDDKDISVGLRLAGIECVVVDSPEQFNCAFEEAVSNQHVAVLIVPRGYAHRNVNMPLVVEI